jgi:hypothetical protein
MELVRGGVSETGHLACPGCGGVWLRLRAGVSDQSKGDGLLCLEPSGRVIAWTGVLQCPDCTTDVDVVMEREARKPLFTVVTSEEYQAMTEDQVQDAADRTKLGVYMDFNPASAPELVGVVHARPECRNRLPEEDDGSKLITDTVSEYRAEWAAGWECYVCGEV